MIIFDLDGTLADCEHRRYFVDPNRHLFKWTNTETGKVTYTSDRMGNNKVDWKPDWRSFYESCSEDKPIQPVIEMFKLLSENNEVQIWSGRCESVRIKTHAWIFAHTGFEPCRDTVKMRPIGDSTPDDVLKERWLDEYLSLPTMDLANINGRPTIEFVFDDRPKVVRMWRRRGIFVFDCNQDGKEF